jgi:hypothetical protein
MNIYPNPFTHSITISTGKRLSKLELYSQTGQLIFSEKIENKNKNEEISIDLSYLAKGVYQLKLTGEVNLQVEKVVKF